MTLIRARHHRILGAASALLLTVTLASCGSDDTPAAEPAGQNRSDNGPGGGQGGGPGFPGAFGEVAAVDGTTAQIRNQQSGQVAVSWTGDTTFTAAVGGTADDIKVGDCVRVTGSGQDSADAAEAVSVTEPVDGSCASPGFGGSDRRPEGRQPPDGAPDGTPPEGAPSQRPGGERPGGMVLGEVTKVDGDTVTVAAMSLAGGPPSDIDTEPTTETTTVAVGSDTRITTTADADAEDVKVGVCVTAQGEADSAGAITAESIAISQPVDGECGFPGGPRGGGMRPGNGAGS